MKYWLYENKRITGPLDAEALMRRPGFGGRTLVCPADRTGQAPGDWAAAATVPELIGGPSRPPAPPAPLAPEPPGFDSERVASEFEGLRRMVAALEMRLKQLEEAETRDSAKADSRQAGVDERLERLSDAIAAQDVKAEATDAALAACRASLNDLRDAVDEANTHIENAVRRVLEQAGASKEIEAARVHLEGALRDGLAGLHRLIRAAELKVDTLDARADGLEAAHAAQKPELEASLRNILAESDPTKTMVALHERLDRLTRTLSDAQTRITDAEERRRLDGPRLARVDELERSLEGFGGSLKDLEDRVAELAAPAGPAPAPAARLDELSSSVDGLSTRLDEVKEGLAKLEARAADDDARLPEPSAVPTPPGEPGAVEATARELDALAVRVSELERRGGPAAAPAEPAPPPAESPQLAAKVDGLATGLVAVQKRFMELEGREARLDSLGGRLEDVANGLEELRGAILRLESKSSESPRHASDSRIEGLADTLASLRDRLARLEPALKPQAAAPAPVPRRAAPWVFAASGSVTAAAALGLGLWLGRGLAPAPPAPAPQPIEPPSGLASTPPAAEPAAPAPVPEPAASVPAPETPLPEPPAAPAAPAAALTVPAAPASEPPKPPAIEGPASPKQSPPRRAEPALGSGPAALEPPKKRAKVAGQRVVYSAKPAKLVPGEVQLLQARLRKDGVVLKLSEPLAPKASFVSDPPRLVLDFAKAPSDLPPKDLGGLGPRILQFRVREADIPPRLLWVEIQLDKPASYKLQSQGDTLSVTLEFAEAAAPAPSQGPKK